MRGGPTPNDHPGHYEGWKHFTVGRADVERAMSAALDEVHRAVRWLPPGRATEVMAFDGS
jgi:hypothetical protein